MLTGSIVVSNAWTQKAASPVAFPLNPDGTQKFCPTFRHTLTLDSTLAPGDQDTEWTVELDAVEG